MKTIKVPYKKACEKYLPFIDWYMHKGRTARCGVLWTRQGRMQYIVIKNNRLYLATGPLEAEYIAEN